MFVFKYTSVCLKTKFQLFMINVSGHLIYLMSEKQRNKKLLYYIFLTPLQSSIFYIFYFIIKYLFLVVISITYMEFLYLSSCNVLDNITYSMTIILTTIKKGQLTQLF